MPDLTVTVIVAAGTLLFLRVIATSRTIRSCGDADGLPLDARRVMWAQALALAGALSLSMSGTFAVTPLWIAILAAGVWQAGSMIRTRGA
jgi:hypothetical protein